MSHPNNKEDKKANPVVNKQDSQRHPKTYHHTQPQSSERERGETNKQTNSSPPTKKANKHGRKDKEKKEKLKEIEKQS